MKTMLQRPWFIRLFNWEYWPFNVVYIPVFFYWAWLSVKARAVFFFNTCNPSIQNGGFMQESKKAIYDLMPLRYYPATLIFKPGTSATEILKAVQESQLQYPLIAKPDIGLRGMGVQKVNTEAELLTYAYGSKVSFLVQQFVPFENEAGIFYYRFPGEAKGHISGIAGKEFLTVKGDGVSAIEHLLMHDPRYILQIATLQKTHANILKRVLAKDEKYLLVPYGNHCRGTKFTDISHMVDDELTNTIDAICKNIPHFYFGRMDIRYNSWQELRVGKNFSIIELNGAGSEPVHIYDPRHSIFYAWKEIIRHLIILHKISRQNHKALQMPYMKFTLGMQMLKENKAYIKLISNQ